MHAHELQCCSQKSVWESLRAKGMTVIGSDEGMDLAAFRASVSAQIEALDGEEWPAGLLDVVKALAR